MHFVTAIDYFLYALVALTSAMILYKALHLWAPGLLGRKLGTTPTGNALDEHIESLEGGLTLLAVIAGSAPFVGLAGTVMHIMDALSRLASASIDISLISGPIATALNSTLIGLCSAVPALVAYNLMQRRIQVLTNRLRRAGGKEA